jgi:tetratricopeptide (TPR) repeat protein
MQGIDETLENAPEWYQNVITAIGRDKPEEALRQALEAVATCQKSADKVAEVSAVRAVTKANIAKGDLWNAKRTADEGLQLAKSIGDKAGEAAALHTLAAFHLQERKPDQAKFRSLAAVEAYRTLQNKVGEACASNTLALAYLAKKEIQQAQELAEQAETKFKELHDNNGVGMTSYTKVQILLEQGKREKALDLLDDLMILYRDLNDYNRMGLVELASAEVYFAKANLQDAINKATSAAECFEGMGDVKKRGLAVLLMARAFEKASQLEDVRVCAEAAYEFFDQARDARGKAQCMELLGNGSSALRMFSGAAYYFENAAFLARQLKDRAMEASMLNQLAKAQLAAFDVPEEAPPQGWQPDDILAPVRNSKRACALYIELGAATSAGHGQALMTLALALLNTTGHEEAFGRTYEAQRIFKLLDDPEAEALAIIVSAKVLMSQGQKDQALAQLDIAMKLAKDSGVPETISKVQAETSRVESMIKPKQKTQMARYDLFISTQGEEKFQFTSFESRPIAAPQQARSKANQKDSRVAIDREVAPRALEQTPVLFEARKIPAAGIIERAR